MKTAAVNNPDDPHIPLKKQFPQRTGYFFRQFVNATKMGFSFHPNDMRRFYAFIYAAHQGRARLCEAQVEALLIEQGFSHPDSERLASIYNHGRNLLRTRFNFNYLPWRKG